MQQDPQNLPNYKHPSYIAIAPNLKLLWDVWNDLEGVKATYLHKAQKEPDAAYNNRVAQAVFNNRLRPTIESNVGLLTAFELTNLPATIEAAKENLDNQGTDYKAFFQEADTLALRDRHCYIMVDYPETQSEGLTLADQLQSRQSPYLKLIDRRCLLNWRSHSEAGRTIIDQVVIEMVSEVATGVFGTTNKTQYHQLKRGEDSRVEHVIWEIRIDKNQEVAVEVGRSLTSLTEIPIVCYPFTGKPFNTDIPPFLRLATLNLKLFRKESNLDEIEYRVNCPTVFRKHPTIEIPANLPPVTFGSSWVLEIPNGGDVGVLEIAGSGIAALQASIASLKLDIEAEGSGFLSGARVQRTATEAYLDSAQIQASLSGLARNKASAIQRVFDFWCSYTNEENTVQVEMDQNLLEPPLDASELGALLNMWQGGAIDHQTYLDLLKMGHQLPSTINVQEILERVKAETEQQTQAQIPDLATLAIADPQQGDFN